jgi:DNA-binding response OmpR family regulator
MKQRRDILLIDGTSPLIGKISFILQNWGYPVMVAPDAVTAWDEVQHGRFALILVSLDGYEEDKLRLMRRTKRRSPHAKVIVIGNPNMMLPMEGFQVKVDDYLLASFTAIELSLRVDRWIRDDGCGRRHQGDKGEAMNGRVLNILKFKIRDLHNGLLSLKANINALIDQECTVETEDAVNKACEISHDLLRLTGITESILHNMLICCSEREFA